MSDVPNRVRERWLVSQQFEASILTLGAGLLYITASTPAAEVEYATVVLRIVAGVVVLLFLAVWVVTTARLRRLRAEHTPERCRARR